MTTAKTIEDTLHLSGGTNTEGTSHPERQLLFGRGSGGGKDSHSRQWRLSMAVFLNRNKRPSAAPIEVAEASLREVASLAYLSNKKEGVLC